MSNPILAGFQLGPLPGFSPNLPGAAGGTVSNTLPPLDPRHNGSGIRIVPIAPGGGFTVRPGTPPPLDQVKAPYAPPLPAGAGGGTIVPIAPTGAGGGILGGIKAGIGSILNLPGEIAGGVAGAVGTVTNAPAAISQTITDDVNGLKTSATNSLKVIGVELLFFVIFVVALIVFLSQTDAGQTVVETVKQTGREAATAAILA